ncbi:MAG TPA: T9SS type A sorting domain-containing protein, partial [Flavobacterium sp.]|nr:T9SS type A sorting domain-containing protein [Flavobacterium sp.]
KDLSGNIKLDKNASPYSNLPFSTWVTLIVYLDYNNKKVYFETPYFNTIAVADFLKNSTSSNLIEDFKPTVLAFLFASQNQTTTVDMVNKYDNIKITALNAVPPYVLNAENFLAQKFNLYPNPATNIVNITNSENMAVQQVIVYDVAGKQLSTQTFNNETEIQLNVENLASGTYMLHIKTNEGVAVKKVVKK